MEMGIKEGKDRISSLPESLIHHILSFLLMKDVVRTCLLSKRWRNIWKSVPVLNFGKKCYDPWGNNFIDQCLIHYEGQKVKTLQFELASWNEVGRLESWVHFAAMHGVEELDMSSSRMLPSCLFECLETRVLKLTIDYLCSPQPFRFPLLTELHITDLKWNYLDTSACPLLQVLILETPYTFDIDLEIHAPNPKLRYLDISESCDDLSGSGDEDYDMNSTLTIYAPNLLYFKFEGCFGRHYEFKDMSSVQTLSIRLLVDSNDYGMAKSLVNFLRKLTHVKSLKLCQNCLQVLAYEEIPSFSATCLELETTVAQFVLLGITSLLRASRCIKRLIINMEDSYSPLVYFGIIFKDHDIEVVKAWESLEHALSVEVALDTILIQNFPGCHHNGSGRELNMKKFHFEVKLVEVLLKSCKMLKEMNICITNPPLQPLDLQLLYGPTKKLLGFPRASVKAKVYFS